MRKDSRKANILDVARCHGYHGSRFNALSYYDSDRKRPLSSVAVPRGFGLEIETECSMIKDTTAYANVLEKIVLADLPDDFCRLESDCSLGGNGYIGIEIPTQIMTKNRMRNEYSAFKSMFDWMPYFGISCADTGKCGMHVNISAGYFGRTKAIQHMAMKKLIYFVNHNYRFCCKAFMRDANHTNYCGKMRGCDDKNYVKNLNLDEMYNDHGACINGAHIREPISSSRIELRLVAGQPKYAAFRNTMEMVFFICDRVKTISWDDIDNLTVFFEKCNNYVVQRLDLCRMSGLLSNTDYETIKLNSVYENYELNRD